MTERTQRPKPGDYNPYYQKYVDRVPEGDIVTILRDQLHDTREVLRRVPNTAVDFAYAPGKWTIKEVVMHMADLERIFGYRLLRFARGDATPLEGFDENAYVAPARCASRALGQILEEFTAVRGATLALLNGLPPESWSRAGSANGAHVTVNALATIMAGHELHHRALLEERYLGALA